MEKLISLARLTRYDEKIKADYNGKIGTLSSLATTNNSNIVAAVNEVSGEITSLKEASVVSVDTSTTTAGMSKSYTIKQGDNNIAVIDIPLDMVVSGGQVVNDPEGMEPGKYIELTIANKTNDKLYISVKDLVDVYTSQKNATQIQLAISNTNEISATIVAGSITVTELANDAVETSKIKDGNVTKQKLSQDVQNSLDLADSALQESDITICTEAEIDALFNED